MSQASSRYFECGSHSDMSEPFINSSSFDSQPIALYKMGSTKSFWEANDISIDEKYSLSSL